MDRSRGGMGRNKRVASALTLGLAMGAVLFFSLGNVDRNAASSGQRTSTRIDAVRGSQASAVAAQADAGAQEQRLPGHSELDLQLD